MEPAPLSQTQPSPPQRVLLIEDDPKLEELLRQHLAEPGIEVAQVASGEQALPLLWHSPFDLVLLDLGLPGANGFEILKEIKSKPAIARIPIIVLTAWNNTSDKVQAFELGATDYVTKPFEFVELKARVRANLRAKRLQDELARANEELTQARLVAEQAVRSKTQFLASMSHEIRTPMNGVVAMTEILLNAGPSAEQRDCLETIRSSGETLLHIIDDILHFSKIESGHVELEMREFDIRRCLEETLDLLAAKASEKHLDLACLVSQDIPRSLVGDVNRLRQVLVNLIANAIKFTHKGDIYVEVNARKADPADTPEFPPEPESTPSHIMPTHLPRWDVHFAVRDTGIGIAEDRMGRLFKTFSQVDSSINRQFGGTGLGLAISKGLVEIMGGTMWVTSQPDKGSVFQFKVPLRAREDKSIPASQSIAHASLRGETLLIVDDNPTARHVLIAQTRQWGMHPHACESAAQAVAWLSNNPPPALAVIDMEMPGVDGFALARKIRELPACPNLPLVLASSILKRPESIGEAKRLFAAFITKPAKADHLAKALASALEGTSCKIPPSAAEIDAIMKNAVAPSPVQLRILLVDDNAVNRKVAVRMLAQLGYDADIVSNGLEAVQAVETKPYDLIFMDLQMPKMDGLDATRHIRKLQQSPLRPAHLHSGLAIVAMTANVLPRDRDRCLEAGMDDFLAKPVRSEALQQVLARFAARLQEGVTSQAGHATASPLDLNPAMAPEPMLSSRQQLIDEPPPVPVDLDRLMEFAGGDLEQLRELVDLYLEKTSDQIRDLHEAITRRASDDVMRLAHSSAGASATCGMLCIAPPLRELERQAAEGNLDNAEELHIVISNEFGRIQAFLQRGYPQLSAAETYRKAI